MTSALTTAMSIQSLLNTNGATFLMTSHVRSALWTLSSTKFLLSKDNTWQPVCIYYAVTMRNMWFSGSFFSFLKLEAKKAKVTLNWNCIRSQFCDPLNWIVNFEQPEKLAKKVAKLRSVYPIRLHILWTQTTIHAPL